MPTRTIIEIDDREIRVAQATWDARRAHLSKAFVLEIEVGTEPKELGKALRESLNRNGFSKGDADVILNRRLIEMRELALPPAPDDELPDILKFAARNEFASVNDNWRVDFVPLTTDVTANRVVLAGALSPQLLAEITTIVEAGGLRLGRILLRSFCVAQAVCNDDPGKSVLIAHVVGNSLDLTLVQDRKVQMTRSVLLSGESEPEWTQNRSLEIQRAVMLANRGGTVRGVGEVRIASDSTTGQQIRTALESMVDVPVLSLDVSGLISKRGENLGGKSPQKFLSHYGAAQLLTGVRIAQLDFSNPRRRAVKKSNYRKLAFWGGLAAALLVATGIAGWMMLSSQTNTIGRLGQALAELKKANESSGQRPGVDQIIGEVKLIDDWQQDNVNWLAELGEISGRLLTADDAMVGQFTGQLGRSGAEIKLRGRTTLRETNTKLKTNLANRPFKINEGRSEVSGESTDYPVQFDYGLQLDREKVDVPTTIAERIRADREKTGALPKADNSISDTDSNSE